MWPWKQKAGQDGSGDRLGTLSRRVDDLESKQRTLGLEWNDVLDRLERIAGRLAKRDQRAEAAVLTGPRDVEAPPTPQPLPAQNSAMAQVLRRRTAHAPPGGANAVLRR